MTFGGSCKTLPRVNGGPRRDLWTAMSRRLEAQQPRLAWYDWAAAGLAAGILAAFPDLALVILYHL